MSVEDIDNGLPPESECAVDPTDTPDDVIRRLIAALNDGRRDRGLVTVAISLKNLTGAIRHTWTDGDGNQYRIGVKPTRLTSAGDVSVTGGPDVFQFTGGSVYARDLGDTDAQFACPNRGTVRLVIDREPMP